jgi:hypothetical protein
MMVFNSDNIINDINATNAINERILMPEKTTPPV